MSSSIDLNSDSRAGQGGAWIGLGESRFTPRYASFLRTVPRGGVIREGRVNPMQLAGLDAHWPNSSRLALIPARLDASHDRRFRHADSFRGLPEGVTHVLLSVP